MVVVSEALKPCSVGREGCSASWVVDAIKFTGKITTDVFIHLYCIVLTEVESQ